MMYSAYKLNKQGDNIQPRCTPLPVWNQISHFGNTIKDRNGMDLTEAEDGKDVATIHRRTMQKRS